MEDQDGEIDLIDLWRSLRREAQRRVNEKFPDENVQFNGKMFFFCNEVVYRMRHLFKFYINDPKLQKELDLLILDTIDELLSLPADVANFSPAEPIEKEGLVEYRVMNPSKTDDK